jgi:hypothetical protein
MRIHQLAMLALLAAAVSTGCDSARDVKDATTHANAWGCDQCHGYPPPPMFPADASLVHPKDVTATECYVCHPGTVQPDGHTIVMFEKADSEGRWTLHRDGQVESYNYKLSSCDLCHGLPPATGRHTFHVTTRGLTCGACHQGYDPTHDAETGQASVNDTLHMNGTPDVVLGTAVGAGQVITTYDLPDKSWPDAECTDCHAKAGVTVAP